ncbi:MULTISPECIES: sensor histidine kinase KdpD [unclassified Deinococcus]|uniref:sensor histidine kinase n=1 Tax=unclassified Deinococcus TaxID=2623546 RepID=UPI001C899D2E|nr:MULTISPECIES: HAMP domain-containing sensor histidine kinase [unclassified Deinococcus]MBX8464580.1 HAMP domain-containing histidine kinase [Deinococcus sp. RIT780]MCD0157680.1 HAMP domain-containing histidine kinase [Deinococcus sp. 6GRE01]MCD0170097.1 HAMP domain-containing histidine kinase [Deinococcus sp. 23YEL01]MCD0176253.1 HAMP domain-containing histidine kinase [Deinococcus sp. 14RED07]
MSRASTAPTAPATRRGALGRSTLRAQFTLVIFMLAFLPNVVLTVTARPSVPTSTLLAWMLVVGSLCALVGYVLSGTLLRSVSRLQNEVERGDFTQPHPDDPSEILALRGAFSGLLGRLGTEQGRRNAFMATLVHDLKTPLIATGHLTRALTTLPLPEEERRAVGDQIQAETTRLLALVQQMADAHRFEQEDVTVQLVPTDLRAVLDDVAARLAPQTTGRTLTVSGHGYAGADPTVLDRAVTNLAVNALRYAHTHVELKVTPRGIEVTDDGPGLPAPLDTLAQPFNAQPTTIAGQQYTAGTAGLGLFIVRRIAEAHGGALHYDRAPPGVPPDPEPRSPDQNSPDLSAPPAALTRFTLELPEVTP